MTDSMSGLRGQLERWTAEGIIDAGQAARIETAERARTSGDEGRAQARRGVPLVAEVLGYPGALVAISAGYVAVRHLWPQFPPAATLSFTGIVTVGLIVAGGLLQTRDEPAYVRLRSVLWMLATLAGAGFAGILAADVFHLGYHGVFLTWAATWAGLSAVLWWRSKSALLHVVMFGAMVALLSAGLYQREPDLSVRWYGLAIWALSVIWGLVADRGFLSPRTAGLAAASTGVLAGATMTMGPPAGQALAVLTVAGLLAIGAVTRRVIFIAFGAAGALWVIPVSANRYLPGSVAAPVAVAAAGLVLLATALWLARTRKKVSQAPH